MKVFLQLIGYVLLATVASAQPNTQWAIDIGSSSSEFPTRICSDNAGNSYLAGAYYNDLILCETLPTVNQPPSSNQTLNLFISKLDSSGNCVWTRFGVSIVAMFNSGAVAPEITDIKYADGFVYCLGGFTNKMVFGSDTLFNTACQTYCNTSFMMKLDTSGTIIWTKCFQGSTSYTKISALAPFNKSIYVAGTYQGTIICDTIQLYAPGSWAYSGYLMKLNSAGHCEWAQNIGTNNYCEAKDMAFDNNKNLYITGNYYQTLDFPTTTLNDSTPAWARSTYFAKYDTTGNFIWARGGRSSIVGYMEYQNISLNNSGLYFNAAFTDSVRFGSTTFTTGNNTLYKDVLVKLDTAGNFIWCQATGNRPNSQNFNSIVEANNAGFMLLSNFLNSTVVGSNTITSVSGSLDNLLTQYDQNGNVLWFKKYGGTSQEIAKDIHCNNNLIYLVARTSSNYTFDGFNIAHLGMGDMLIARMKNNSTITTLQQEDHVLNYALYPNPTTHYTTISATEIIDHIIVTDLLGQEIFRLEPKKHVTLLELDKGGIYFVTIISGNRVKSQKLIVIH